MNIRLLLFLIILIFSNSIHSQVKLLDEIISGNKYILKFSNEILYSIAEQGNKSIIEFKDYLNEGKSGQFILPQKDFFITIPPNTKPKVEVSVPVKKFLSAIPKVNPEVKLLDDSTLAYNDTKPILSDIANELYKVNGYFWIGNHYCIHITVNMFQFDIYQRKVIKNEEIIIEFDFDDIIKTSGSNKDKNSIFSNNFLFSEGDSKFPKNAVDNSDGWIDYSKTYLKIGTAVDAIYRISKEDLTSYSIPANSIDPRTFKLFSRGVEIPIYVAGEGDGIFDSADFIEFVGKRNYGYDDYRELADDDESYREYIDIYSDTTIYWLTWHGSNGIRISTEVSADGPIVDTTDYYDELIHVEEQHFYDYSLSGGQVRRETPEILENETWIWWGQGVGTRNFNFQISQLYPNKPANAYVKVQSYASGFTSNAHNLYLQINSDPTIFSEVMLNKYDVAVLSGEIQSSLLNNGSNNLKLTSTDVGNFPNTIAGDWWEMEYPRYLTVDNDSLLFAFRSISNEKNTVLKISNVISNQLSFYKLNPNGFSSKITNYQLNNNVLTLEDKIVPRDTYIITATSKISKPKYFYKKNFINLHNYDQQVDYILITHPIFLPVASNYISFIENNYNVSTLLVNVNDIYDEFNFGFFAAEPIKEFLKTSNQNWPEPFPTNVFLVGKANYDFHGYKSTFRNEPVEPCLLPSFGVPVSDNWFVIWDSTGAAIPQLNIGRLPARSIEEFQHYADKHQSYLANGFNEWNKRYLLFTGGNYTNPSQIERLKAANNFVAEEYIKPSPIGGIPTHFYKTPSPITNFGPYTPEEIQSALNSGGVFISYIGHSGTQTWDNSVTDPTQLNNGVDRNPMITDFGCSTAKFAEPDVTSFSELFVNGLNGQAIAYVGNSSLGFESTAVTFPKFFYGTILRDSVYNIGDAHRLSKIQMLNDISTSGTYRLFSYTNSIVGDPIINLQIPSAPNFLINSEDVNLIPLIPTDKNDSINVELNYSNLGRVIQDTLEIKIEDIYKGEINSSSIFKKPVPLNFDEFSFSIPIKDLPGEHKLKIFLDADNRISEYEENDNNIELTYNVASASIRTNNIYGNGNLITNYITFLNPTADPLINNFELEISLDKDFQNSNVQSIPFDTFYTNYSLGEEYLSKQFWMRARIPNSNKISVTQSFLSDSIMGFFVNDSIGFNNFDKLNVSYKNNSVSIDSSKINFELLSAGFHDGFTARIVLNDKDLIPENTLTGHHVCIFKDTTYEFINYKRFDLLNGGATAVDEYISLLDTLDEKYLFLVAITDEGRVTSSDLKNKIKEFGSIYIDSVKFRGSWAFMGKFNASPGSMPEVFSNPYDGRVTIDTSIVKPQLFGSITTSVIGPATDWHTLTVGNQIIENSQIKIRTIGVKDNIDEDTLSYLTFTNDEADLSIIQAGIYPKLKFFVEFLASSTGKSPLFNSLFVAHTGLPELGTNYQVAAIDRDTLEQGETIDLTFYVFNAGHSTADSFKVCVDLIHENNDREKIFENRLSPILPFSKQLVNINYNTVGTNGSKQFLIQIDSDNQVNEIYEDNNFYSLPFYIKGDTTRPDLRISFDGKDILDGEFVSTNPLIHIELFDPSLVPISMDDTASISLYLNNQRISYNELDFTVSDDNPKATVDYNPLLENGEYELIVFGQDASGNLVDSSGIRKQFVILDETKILNIFNYPNPFADNTYFTFTLTQIPDELKFRIYTVAGRLVREIYLNAEELNFDFNKVFWDGRDADGDELANGVYICKVLMINGEDKEEFTQKLAKIK